MKTLNKIQNWTPLKKGDLVDVVAPGARSEVEDLNKSLEILNSWGLRTRLQKAMNGKTPYYSNTDDIRALGLWEAITAKDSQAVWCLRGGYGCQRLLPFLKTKKPQAVKPFLGYSDITVLHHYFSQYWGWQTLHAPVLDGLHEKTNTTKNLTRKVLMGEVTENTFKGIRPLNESAKVKTVNARLAGGNLKVLTCLLGTDFEPDFKNKILFLEDVHERGYALDRMFTQLEQAGKFKGLKGVVFGDFTGGIERDGKDHKRWALKQFASSVKFPVWQGLKSGHEMINYPLPIGGRVNVNKNHMQVFYGNS